MFKFLRNPSVSIISGVQYPIQTDIDCSTAGRKNIVQCKIHKLMLGGNIFCISESDAVQFKNNQIYIFSRYLKTVVLVCIIYLYYLQNIDTLFYCLLYYSQ